MPTVSRGTAGKHVHMLPCGLRSAARQRLWPSAGPHYGALPLPIPVLPQCVQWTCKAGVLRGKLASHPAPALDPAQPLLPAAGYAKNNSFSFSTNLNAGVVGLNSGVGSSSSTSAQFNTIGAHCTTSQTPGTVPVPVVNNSFVMSQWMETVVAQAGFTAKHSACVARGGCCGAGTCMRLP